MKLVEDKWTENLYNLQYGDGYDIRVHAAQVALSILARRTNLLGNINFSTVRFGYYDTNTESAIEAFQKATGIYVTKKLDRITYEKLFDVLRGRLNVTILEVGENQLRVSEITKDIADLLPDFNYPNNNENNDDTLFGDENSNLDFSDDMFGQSDEINWGDLDIGEYNPNGNYNSNDFLDDYWKHIKEDDADDTFTIFTPDFPDFGGGGGSPFRPGGNGEDYTDINGYPSTGNENHDFIDNLLSNSIYKGNFDYEKPISWMSKSEMNINVNGFRYDNSDKYGTFFDSRNSSETRNSGYDITIVYGANSQLAKKIVDIRPRSKSQQIDSSGEAIYDVIEFIAKDVIETDNRR